MTTVSPSLARLKKRFAQVCKAQEGFVCSLPSLQKNLQGKSTAINASQQETLCEMAFVVLFTAWEQFLETSFETYVVEAPLSAFRNRHRVLVIDVETARGLIRGSRKYVEWSEPQAVRDRAEVFFKRGEPFESALSAVTDDVQKMKTIRNRCVHHSQHAIEQYEKMIRKIFGAGRRLTPGRLLLNAPPPGLSTGAGAGTYSSVFRLYSEILSTAAGQIVPGRR